MLEVFFKKVDFVLNTFNTEKIYKKLAKNKNKIKRYSKKTKKYIEKEHILTEEEKREKIKNDNNSATSELLDRY